jgi:hypothetical protein
VVAGFRPPCLRQNFAQYRAVVDGHEGSQLQNKSHLWYYEQRLNPAAATAVESVVGSQRSMGTMADEWKALLRPITDAARLDMPRADQTNKVDFGCNFEWNYAQNEKEHTRWRFACCCNTRHGGRRSRATFGA